MNLFANIIMQQWIKNCRYIVPKLPVVSLKINAAALYFIKLVKLFKSN